MMDDFAIAGFEEPTEYGKKLLIVSSLCDFAKILKETRTHESQFPRSGEDNIQVASPEDVILKKLVYFRDGGVAKTLTGHFWNYCSHEN